MSEPDTVEKALREIEEMHVESGPLGSPPYCRECLGLWPCDAIRLVRAVRAQRECMAEHDSNCPEFDVEDYSDYILAALRGKPEGEDQ